MCHVVVNASQNALTLFLKNEKPLETYTLHIVKIKIHFQLNFVDLTKSFWLNDTFFLSFRIIFVASRLSRVSSASFRALLSKCKVFIFLARGGKFLMNEKD